MPDRKCLCGNFLNRNDYKYCYECYILIRQNYKDKVENSKKHYKCANQKCDNDTHSYYGGERTDYLCIECSKYYKPNKLKNLYFRL